MPRPVLEALLGEDGAVGAPAVGKFRPLVEPGVYLPPGTLLGRLKVLGRFFDVRLPATGGGWLTRLVADDLTVPVGYGQTLLELATGDGAGPAAADARGTTPAASDPAEEDAALAGLEPIRSQTDGVFYRRPNPADPAFVDEGGRVESGTVLGLVEIMKFFNKIRYELDRPGKVARIIAEDGAEVKSGAILMYVELE